MAKKPEPTKSANVPVNLVSPRKALAMGMHPNTGAGGGPKTKQ